MQKKNKVYNGDCREILKSFDNNSIAACITDPPYNYEFIGKNWDQNEITRRTERIKDTKTLVKNIPYGSGLAGGIRNKTWYEKNAKNIIDYQNWVYEWASEVYRVCKPGALVAIFNSTRTIAHIQIAFEKAGFYSRDCLVYRRHSGIPKGNNIEADMKKKAEPNYENWKGWHSCLRNEWEAIYVGQKPLTNNYYTTIKQYNVGAFYTSNEDGSFQSNILEGFQREKHDDFNIHCTVKPLRLMEKLVKMMVPQIKGNIVLDPFAGSGTTLVAAKKLGVDYIGIEIESSYIEIINKRLEERPKDLY